MSLAQRIFDLLALGLATSLIGCGGSTRIYSSSSAGSTNAGATNAGSTNAGATNAGATSATSAGATSAGATNAGATNAGATSGAGAASVSGGSGTSTSSGGSGGGAASDDVCDLPWDGGECDAVYPRYWHNPVSGQCELRTYGGCGGNENQFDTYEICKFACNAVEDPSFSCTAPADCELRSANCCGACEPLAAGDLIAVNQQAPETDTCNMLCAACPPVAPNESTTRYFIPGCDGHRCTVVDIRQTAITQCLRNSDCRLRNTAACCERCGDSGDPIAYNANINLTTAFCGGTPQPCPHCVGGVPVAFDTECLAGRCVVEYVK